MNLFACLLLTRADAFVLFLEHLWLGCLSTLCCCERMFTCESLKYCKSWLKSDELSTAQRHGALQIHQASLTGWRVTVEVWFCRCESVCLLALPCSVLFFFPFLCSDWFNSSAKHRTSLSACLCLSVPHGSVVYVYTCIYLCGICVCAHTTYTVTSPSAMVWIVQMVKLAAPTKQQTI